MRTLLLLLLMLLFAFAQTAHSDEIYLLKPGQSAWLPADIEIEIMSLYPTGNSREEANIVIVSGYMELLYVGPNIIGCDVTITISSDSIAQKQEIRGSILWSHAGEAGHKTARWYILVCTSTKELAIYPQDPEHEKDLSDSSTAPTS